MPAPLPFELPPVIGHRGAARIAPENTLAGLRAAAAAGAGCVEFDVKLTADGTAVLFHDDGLERTTDGRGRLRDLPLDALRRLDAGAWFDPRFAGERVPTFAEALALCADLGLGVNVEIKPDRGREVETAAGAMSVLSEHWPAAAPAIVSSFEPVCLEVARASAPDRPRGYLTRSIPGDWRDAMARLDCATLHVGTRRLGTGVRLSAAIATGVPVLLYTVNHPRRARELFALGVRSVFSDDPAAIAPAAPR